MLGKTGQKWWCGFGTSVSKADDTGEACKIVWGCQSDSCLQAIHVTTNVRECTEMIQCIVGHNEWKHIAKMKDIQQEHS